MHHVLLRWLTGLSTSSASGALRTLVPLLPARKYYVVVAADNKTRKTTSVAADLNTGIVEWNQPFFMYAHILLSGVLTFHRLRKLGLHKKALC